MSEYQDELRILRVERDSIAIAAANAALVYFECLDVEPNEDVCEVHLHNLKEIIRSYRMAKRLYYNWLFKGAREETEE